jgi:predicted ABC-type ATPase
LTECESRQKQAKQPWCIVIAGPNGAGKTTFAREFLPKDARVVNFVNADLIAGGLSPLRPELAALAAGRLGSCRIGSSRENQAGLCFRNYLELTDLLEPTKTVESRGLSG